MKTDPFRFSRRSRVAPMRSATQSRERKESARISSL